MRYITVPEDITMLNSSRAAVCKMEDPVTRQLVDLPPVSFKKFVLDTLLFDEKWMQSYAYVRAAKKIEEAARCSNGVMALEDADWEKLKIVCEHPSNGRYIGYNAMGIRNLCSFLEAIVNASDKQPS